MQTTKIAVAMSGGIDSSIAALLLQEQGYDIIGITLRIWDYLSEEHEQKEIGCSSMESILEAKDFCEKIGVQHYIVDVRTQFKNIVVENFVSEYLDARTPNPCVICNPTIKWAGILQKADELGCSHIATGHYSQIAESNGRYFFKQAADSSKDQSYMLWQLHQEQIKRTLLPLGSLHKSEIKKLATERGFTQLAEKRESQEICFIPDNNYRNFLKSHLPELEKKVQGGNFISTKGTIIGTHDGYPFYTIGQRKGLRIALGKPAYVIAIDKETNQITIGEKQDVFRDSMIIDSVNCLKYDFLPENTPLHIKIRYNTSPAACYVEKISKTKFKVFFNEPISAITPGQSAVFYEGSDMIAGAIIIQ